MAEDKKAIKEQKRRRLMLIRRIKVGAALCAVLALVLYILCAFVFFKIEAIEIVGVEDENGILLSASQHYTDEEIIQVSGVETGDSLVRVSKRDISENLQKILPYIGYVKINRVYPSTLRITTQDTTAVFGADSGGGFTILDENYKVLDVTERLPKGSMKLVGVSFKKAEIGSTAEFADDAFKSRISSVLSACENESISSITNLDLSNIANVRIVLDSRITIILGTITDLGEKLSLAKKTIEAEEQNASELKIIIDVTDPERSYVRNDYSPIVNEYETEPDEEATIPDEPTGDDEPEEELPDAVG